MPQGHGNKYREYLEARRDFNLSEGMIFQNKLAILCWGIFLNTSTTIYTGTVKCDNLAGLDESLMTSYDANCDDCCGVLSSLNDVLLLVSAYHPETTLNNNFETNLINIHT